MLALIASLSTFYTGFTSTNYASGQTYPIFTNVTTNMAQLNVTVSDIIDGASNLQAEDTNLLTLGLAIVKGTLGIIKLPFQIVNLMNSVYDSAFQLIGIDSNLIALSKVGLLVIVALAIVSVTSKYPT